VPVPLTIKQLILFSSVINDGFLRDQLLPIKSTLI
jgi:hypothetical protein